MSHLCCSDEPNHPANAVQLLNFKRGVETFRGKFPKVKLSLAATGGTLLTDEYHFDLVRCGIGIYGGAPFIEAAPVVRLDAPILQIRDIPVGQGVGYGWTWEAEGPSRIGTLPLGYADGLHRALSNKMTLFFGGNPVPLVGRVSMDLVTVDLSDHPNAKVGDAIEVIGPNQTVDDVAAAAGTIGYEILTSLGHRYARRYTGG
ncbi:UNVERIFIED_CONTAM: hypothetical protein GTU68_056425, partial [Idotea baltica]|nr:hypothetical protein [Idotea baltica]